MGQYFLDTPYFIKWVKTSLTYSTYAFQVFWLLYALFDHTVRVVYPEAETFSYMSAFYDLHFFVIMYFLNQSSSMII